MKQLIILQGIPASGKSTWAKEQVANSYTTIRVCRDDIRNMRGKYLIPEQEGLITKVEDAMIIAGLEQDLSVIVDATNLNSEYNKRFAEYALKYNAELVYKKFDISLEEAIERDSKRENPVGKDVITNFYNKYIINKKAELLKDDRFIKPFHGDKEFCIICDIDGTLALRTNRNPFDERDESLITDKVNVSIKDIVEINDIFNRIIIIVSGRKNRESTEKWLKIYDIPYDFIYTREQNDNRPDEIIKREIYEKYIEPNYNVLFVLDDRDKVVKMWRDLGLTCLQVYYGDF